MNTDPTLLEDHDADPVPGPTLFGWEDPRDRCGRNYAVGFCAAKVGRSKCGRPKIAPTGCHRSRCRTCCWDWLNRAARRATRRIIMLELATWRTHHPGAPTKLWAKKVLEHPEGQLLATRIVHAMASRKHEHWPGADAYLDERRTAARYAKEWGFRGFVAVPHPYRIDPLIGQLLKQSGYGGKGAELGVNGSLWAGVVEDALELGSFRPYVVDGLHNHILGVTGQRGTPDGRLPPGDFHADDGVVLKRLSDCDTVKDVFRCLRYLGSHVATPEGSPAYTYYGDAAKAAKEGPMGGLTENDEEWVDTVLHAVLEGKGSEGGGCRCADCDSIDDYQPIHGALAWLEHQEKEGTPVIWRDSLEVARTLALTSPLHAVRKAVEHGWIDPSEEFQDQHVILAKLRSPSYVERLVGLDHDTD